MHSFNCFAVHRFAYQILFCGQVHRPLRDRVAVSFVFTKDLEKVIQLIYIHIRSVAAPEALLPLVDHMCLTDRFLHTVHTCSLRVYVSFTVICSSVLTVTTLHARLVQFQNHVVAEHLAFLLCISAVFVWARDKRLSFVEVTHRLRIALQGSLAALLLLLLLLEALAEGLRLVTKRYVAATALQHQHCFVCSVQRTLLCGSMHHACALPVYTKLAVAVRRVVFVFAYCAWRV
jgi:hypothetical protein